MTEPHHAHLTEMRASRPRMTADEWRDKVAEIRATLAALPPDVKERRRAAFYAEIEMLRRYPDPTRRHLAEMRLMRAREEVRRACDTCAEYGEMCSRHGSERSHG